MAIVPDLSGNSPIGSAVDRHIPKTADSSSGHEVRLVVPSDTADLPFGTCRALYFEAAGDVAFIDGHGNTVTTYTVAALSQHAIRARRVLATGTMATPIWAIY